MYRSLWYNNVSVDQKDKIQATWQILTAKEPVKSWLTLTQLGLKITEINIAHKQKTSRFLFLLQYFMSTLLKLIVRYIITLI